MATTSRWQGEIVTGMGRHHGLHDRINRILHWDVNVRHLERSIAFYEALTSYRSGPLVLHEDPRTGERYRAITLENTNRAAPTPTLRLIQWLHPAAVGQPHRRVSSIGFTRAVFHVADLDATRRTAESIGLSPFAPTTGDEFRFVTASLGSQPYRVFACHDPDGVIVEFIEASSPKLSTVAQGTGGLEGNLAFFRDILGLDLTDTVETPGPVADVYTPDGGTVEFSGAFFRVRGDDRGYLDWLEYQPSSVRDKPYAEPNHIGVIRCAFEVDDLDEAERALRAALWNGYPIAIEGDAVACDFGPPLGIRRTLSFLDPEGVRYALVEQARYAVGLHPFTGARSTREDVDPRGR